MAQTVTVALLVQVAPYFVVALVGIAIAAKYWHRCPQASALAIAALLGRIVVSGASIALSRFTFSQLDQGVDPATVGYYTGLFNVFASLAGALSLALLVAAVFVGRPERTHGSAAA